MGANFQAHKVRASCAFDGRQKKAGRLIIKPIFINNEGWVEQVPFHGSAHINALVFANALMEIPPGISELKKGDFVYVRPL